MKGDDCNINEAGPKSDKNFKMSDDSCIRQSGRQSFWPGDKGTEGGDYCFVYYKDGDCVCTEGARRIHTNWKKEVECETKMVEGHTSFHFEKAKDVRLLPIPYLFHLNYNTLDADLQGHCPVRGCYGSGGSDDEVARE